MKELESLVLDFLERREASPGLTPEEYADEFPERRSEVLEAVRSAIDIERLLPSQGDRRPETIAGYLILEEIGRGGMGIVYRVEKDGAPFALKLLPAAPLMGPRALERFRREVETLSRLSTEGIVRVHESGLDGEIPYLVMDLIEGTPLHTLGSSLSITDSVILVEQIARTIHVAHEQGIIHRDLKPQNVLVLESGQPVLVDFGLSAATDLATLTGTGDILGTPRYMAPEQMLGEDTDRRTDVHAIGLMLYELTTGTPAYRGTSREAILEVIRRGRISPPRDIRGDLPKPLDWILRTALARVPSRRYPTALAFAEDLRRFLDGDSVVARPPGPRSRAADWWRGTLASIVSSAAASKPVKASLDSDAFRETDASLDRAVSAWLDGDRVIALRETRAAQKLDPNNSTASLLESQLDERNSTIPGTTLSNIQEGIRLLEAGDAAQALTLFEDPGREQLHPPLAAALLGEAAARAGDIRRAEQELTAASRRLPDCLRVHRELGSVYVQLGRFPEAEQILLRTTSLSPQSATVWRDLALVYDKQGNIEPGLAAVDRARNLAKETDPRTERICASLKDQEGERGAARSILEKLVEEDPKDHESHYLLGLSFDRDHRIGEAADAYRRAVALEPTHALSFINLAYLLSGALKGKCRRCDQAFAENPACLDMEQAEEYLLRALEQDRGADPVLTRTAVDVALRLDNRARIVDLVEKLTSSGPKTPEILQLEHTLRALRIADESGAPSESEIRGKDGSEESTA